MQQKWVTKLFGYYYEVIYKKGKENVMVNSLSSIVLSELHASLTIGHSWFTKTYERVKHYFFWDGMK
jgi:hypothetical protein